MNYLVISTICLSLSFGLIKNQLAGLPSDLVAELRLLFAGLIFLPFFSKLELKKHLRAAFIGIIQFGLMYVFYIRAFKYLQGNEIALLTASAPIMVGICSTFLGERFKGLYLIPILLSIFGAIIVIWNNVNEIFLIKGVVLMMLSTFCFSLGQVLWKKYVKTTEAQLMASVYLTSALFVLPFALINTDFTVLFINTNQWLSIFYLGIIPTGVGFLTWNKGAKKVSATTLAVMNNLKIPMGVLFAIIIFHEKINLLNFIIGSFFILISIILSHRIVKS